MNDQFFDKIKLKYDIVNDEIMFPNEKTNTIIILNKSQVSRFSLNFNRSVYEFVKLNTGDIRVDGYIQLIYDGSNRLFKKWEKRVVSFSLIFRTNKLVRSSGFGSDIFFVTFSVS